MSRKVGLLLPKSVLYPSMAFDMMGGLRSALEDGGITDAEINTGSIGLGADDKLIYAACEKMLFDGTGIVAGYVNPLSAEKLEPLFASANAVFIGLDAGYHFPSSTQKFPHLYYLSLQGALCIRTAIAKALAEGRKNIAYTSSFYDAGYRSAFAAHKAIEQGGGAVTFNLVTPLKRADITLAPLTAHLQEATPDAIFASFCGDMLQDYFTAAAAGQVFNGHAVYGSAFVGEEQWLAKSPYPGTDVQVCVPWASALLGWEAGQVAAKALSLDDAATGLEGFIFSGPRGLVKLDATTHQCHAPVYDATVRKDEATGNCLLAVGGESPYTDEERVALERDINNVTGPMTSWYNAYGCLES
jgi:branched-chain amino acid transport system substrate-binding protein